MRTPAIILITILSAASAWAAQTLENKSVAWEWKVTDGKLRPARMVDKLNGGAINLGGECFRIELGDGTILKSSDFNLAGEPAVETLKRDAGSPTASRHEGGHQLVAKFLAPQKNLSAEWRVILRDDSAYVRQELI